MRTYTAWRTVEPLASRRTNDQPAGGVIVGEPRAATVASRASPEAVPAGAGRTRVVAVALFPELALLKTAPAGAEPVVKVHVTGESALDERSVIPDVRFAVYDVFVARFALGS